MKLHGRRPSCYTSHFLFSRAKAASQSDRFVEPDSVCSCLARGFCSSQSCLSLSITDVADCASKQSIDEANSPIGVGYFRRRMSRFDSGKRTPPKLHAIAAIALLTRVILKRFRLLCIARLNLTRLKGTRETSVQIVTPRVDSFFLPLSLNSSFPLTRTTQLDTRNRPIPSSKTKCRSARSIREA